MIGGIERLRRAAAALGRDGGRTADLAEAADEAWAAMAGLPDWPTDLRMRAVELQGDLFRDGSIRMTVGQMTEAELRRLRRKLIEFCEFADRLDHGVAAVEGDQTVGSEKPVAATATA